MDGLIDYYLSVCLSVCLPVCLPACLVWSGLPIAYQHGIGSAGVAGVPSLTLSMSLAGWLAGLAGAVSRSAFAFLAL